TRTPEFQETTDDVHSSLGDEEEDDDFNEGEEQSAEDSAVADGDEDPLIAVEEPYEELVTEIKMQEAEEPRRIQRWWDPKKRDLSAGKGDIFELLQKTNKDWYSVTVGGARTRTVFKRASELEDGAVGVRRPTFRRSAGDLHRRSRRRLSRWRRRGQRRGRCLPESERTAIRHRMEKLDATFADLQALATARERSLAQAVRQFRFFELAEAFNDWLAGKEAALAADEPPYLVLANGSAAVRKRCEQHFQEMAANKGRLDELDGLAKELLADAAAAAKEAAAVAGSAELTAETGLAGGKEGGQSGESGQVAVEGFARESATNQNDDPTASSALPSAPRRRKEQLEERRDLLAERREPGQNLASNAAQLAHHRHLCHELDALKARAAELDYEGRAVKEVHPSESAFIDARLEKLADLAELVSEMAGGRERELCERREKLLLEAEAAKALKRLEEASLAGPLSPARSGTAGFAQQHQQQRRLTSVDEPATGDDEEQQLDQLLASTEALEQSLDAQLAAAGAPRDPQLLALRQRLRAKRGALTDEVQRRRRERQIEATARRFLRDADRAAAGLAAWQRRLAGLRSTQEVDAAASAGLEPLSQRVADLTARWESAQSPRTELAQEDRQKVESRLATANEALASARAATERRRRELRDAAELADFDVAADELAEWLAEKRPSVEDRSHRKAGGDIDRRRMRHRAFEAEMAGAGASAGEAAKDTHAPQSSAAQQLQAKGHPDAQEALNRLEEVESLWSSIETAAAEKGTELDEAQKERQLMERLEAVVEQTDRLAKEAARAPVVEDERSARAQQERQESWPQLAKELAGRGHYNSEAILAAVGKQEAACDSLAPQLAERRHQLDKAEADRQLAASLDRELLWADERLMSAAAVANSANTAPPKTPEAERLLQQSQAGLQTELATRRAAWRKLLQQAEAAGAAATEARKRSSWSKR
uniref:SH3 domain-containing protein n=1 Tax=Macrostomum lignano TaxID=282301 RepID=A0A1I8ISN8_9PLAT